MPDLPNWCLLALTAAILGTTQLPGQQATPSQKSSPPPPPPPPQRGPALVTLTTAAANEAVGCPSPSQHGLVPTRDGSLFTLITRTRHANEQHTGEATSDLELWRSRDRGQSWKRVQSAPTRNNANGALVPDGGQLAVAWTAGNGKPWASAFAQRYDIEKAGNENPQHYALARGPGNQLYAYFAKSSEQFANLWQCVVEDGKPVGSPRIVAPGAPNTFLVITGSRSPQAFSTAHVVVCGTPATAPGGIVSVYGTWPAQTAWSKTW